MAATGLPYKRILVPYDGSAASERGLLEALGLAARFDAELRLLTVLDSFPPVRHKRAPRHLALLSALRDDDPATALAHLLTHSPAGVDLAHFAAYWNLDDAARDALHARLHLKAIGAEPIVFDAAGWRNLATRLLEALTREHARTPDMVGVERERLRRMTLATLSRSVFDALVEELLAAGNIVRTRAWLHLPAHRASVSPGSVPAPPRSAWYTNSRGR